MSLLLILFGSCSSSTSSSRQDSGNEVDAAVDVGTVDKTTPDVAPGEDASSPDSSSVDSDLPPGWKEIKLGGETICSRGTEYSILVHAGAKDRVIVDFQGGGACWSYMSCALGSSLFFESIDKLKSIVAEDGLHGIYDKSRADNPLSGWTHVVIPYCTGDIHWGDNHMAYTSGSNTVEIEHRGAVNARAALAWTYAQYPKPDKIFVTGCSAGSYGSILWAPHVIEQYPDARVYQLGDSGAGIVTDSFLADSFPVWNAEAAMPSWIPELDPQTVSIGDHDLQYFYESIGNHYPSYRFTQYNALADSTQVNYFQYMGGGDADKWSEAMVTMMDELINSTPSFRAFLAPGTQHCIIPHDEFYTVEVNGTRLIDWIDDLVNDREVQNVRCADCVPAS